MGLMWFILGFLAAGIAWGLLQWVSRKKIKLSWVSWAGMVLAGLLGLFTIAWIVSSLVEEVNQAAAMGALLFGGLTAVIFALTRLKVQKDLQA